MFMLLINGDRLIIKPINKEINTSETGTQRNINIVIILSLYTY